MASLRLLLAGMAAGLVMLAAAPGRADEPAAPATSSLRVMLDFATLAKVPDGTQTLIIGNPMVADASVQRNNVMVITGKSYGTTNILALDRNGKALEQITVEVARSHSRLVTVQRGFERESYSCTPRCEPVMVLGDSPGAFNGLNAEINTRNASAGH
ncbi:MAG TPA: pilus assembly protein N-terminal domain-containing protein [Hyphomicrobiales bacterium]|nr:pilus assembly protein N-terminal domain-containing protein [Hyphomicrobiales bacterium]